MTSTQTRPAASPHGHWAALVAAGIPVAPPREWFENTDYPDKTPFTITTEGQVYGRVAPRDVDHVGLPGRGVRAPYSRCDHAYFRTGQTRCSDGSLVATGPITMLTGHADLDADSLNAASHYDHSGTAVADLVTFDRPDGVYCAGAARPGVTPEQIRMAMGSIPSGDWRWINADDFKGQEMVACLLVNHGGFPARRDDYALAASLGWDTKASDLVLDWDNPPRIVTASSSPDTQQETPMPDTDTPESLTAASPNPFSKGEPAPPSGDDEGDGEAYESGDSVLLDDLDVVAQVVGDDGEGGVTIEVTVPSSMLSRADEDTAIAASARFTDRMADRKRDADISKLTAALSTVTAALESERETTAARDAKLDELLAKQRSQEFDRLVASAELD